MKWTPEKLEELRRRYPHEDNGRLARELGCSRKALAFRASYLGIRKTDAANEARYAALSRRAAPEAMGGQQRQIATGTVIVRGNVLTHLSNFSAARDPAKAAAQGEGAPGEAAESPAPRTGDTRRQTACPCCGTQGADRARHPTPLTLSMEA
jgi:hypothetical protein